MRFVLFLKTEENSPLGPPPPELMGAIGMLGEEVAKAGVMVDMAALAPTVMGASVRLSGGEITVTDPIADLKEPVASYAVYDVNSKEEAIEWAAKFMNVHKEHWKGWEGETEIRQVFGPEDFAQNQ